MIQESETTKSSQPIYEYEVEFQTVPGIWCKVDMNPEMVLEILSSGLYKNNGIRKLKVEGFLVEGVVVRTLVYDIEAAKTGGGEIWTLL